MPFTATGVGPEYRVCDIGPATYLDRTLKNPEVEAYLRSIRKDELDLYEGVDELAVALGITAPSKASASSSPPKP